MHDPNLGVNLLMKRLLSILRPLSVLLLSAGVPLAATAQSYPSKTVGVIVPYSPAGPTDLVGRIIAQDFTEKFGKPFIVENKTGASGIIGVDAIAKAKPDGHTLGIVPVACVSVYPPLYSNLPYKAADFAPVSMLATVASVLVVNASTPAKSLKELLALAAAKPGALSFASSGVGSQAHLAGELMALTGNVSLLHVPYKGTAPAVNDLLGNQVTMMFGQISSVLPHIKAGKLRAIGVASLKRSALLPEVPTIAEQGIPGFEAVSRYALMAPAGTPDNVVTLLNEKATSLLAKPEIKDKFAGLGIEPGGGTPQQLAATIESETVLWADVIKKNNIKVE
ncbi:tripartite-type tricarboxylate transporter receptor subunit TctC [Paralcaligenes ureilyticus]|uniref:Tripartite-type tricarboxylate transporter receptor subunit TctC n=2 Tax=Paralcaligenes ureilyticus TaxID=627131 RepID=A0A4R3LPW0_9BURK|nr:tripartite-type tricarboxylate transporter receptor subunit TctC [Paralcaligenes ureilyticus]